MDSVLFIINQKKCFNQHVGEVTGYKHRKYRNLSSKEALCKLSLTHSGRTKQSE